MENIHLIIVSASLIALVSITGILVLKSHRKIRYFVENNLLILTAVSAGVFLVTSVILAKEALHVLTFSSALFSFVVGILLYIILHKAFSPHRFNKQHTHEKHAAWKVLIGDTLHNIADGLLLVASFGVSVSVGIANALSIALHEVPQEISEFLVLKKSGYSNREAVLRNLITALSIFIGIAGGLFLIQTEITQGYLLGITSTFFLGIVFSDLFPIKKLIREKRVKKMSYSLVLGAIIMVTITSFLGHTHSHEEHDHVHEHTLHHHNKETIDKQIKDEGVHNHEHHDGHHH